MFFCRVHPTYYSKRYKIVFLTVCLYRRSNLLSVTQNRPLCAEGLQVTVPVVLCFLNEDLCSLLVVKDTKYIHRLKCAEL